jgi:hypothetical protein
VPYVSMCLKNIQLSNMKTNYLNRFIQWGKSKLLAFFSLIQFKDYMGDSQERIVYAFYKAFKKLWKKHVNKLN